MAPSLALPPFLLAIGAAPWWFGSNRPFAWALNAAALGTLLSAVALRGGGWPAARPLLLPGLLAGAALAWGIAQALPVGPADALWGSAADAIQRDLAGSPSAAPALAAAAVLRALTDACAFLLAWLLVREEATQAFLLAAFVIALLPAAYAIAALAAGDAAVLGVAKRAFQDAATGPFFNRNSLAILCALGIAAGLEWGWAAPRGWRGVAWAGVAVLVLALLLTRSRAGVALAGCGAVALLALRCRLAAAAGVAGLAAALLTAAAALRPSGLAEDAAGRLDVLALVGGAVLERPWTGHGLGGFEALWPMIRTEAFRPEQSWDRAHSSWIEAAFGLGLPAALALALAVLLPWLACLRAALRGVALARFGTVAFGLVALHSAVEFSLQMQGLSLLAFAALGAGLAAAGRAA